MVERLLILKTMNVSNESDNGSLSKGQSFNTDDDDSLQTGHLRQNEENSSLNSKSDHHLLGIDNLKRSVAFLTSPSIDSINDPEGSISDIPLSEKLKRKKQRRSTIKIDSNEQKRLSMKNRSWYLKVDLTKPILVLLFLCLIYLTWAKRDVWIPRLLTSNSRIKHTIQRNEDKSITKEDLTSNKDSTISSNKEDNTLNENQSNQDLNLSDDNEEDSPTISNKQNSQKVSFRIRRNKMSFTRDKQSKSNKYSKYRIIDDDDEDEEEDDDDDDDGNNEEISTKAKEVILPSSIHSSKKHHHHRSDHSHKSKGVTNGKTSIILRPRDDIVEQLRKLIKSYGKRRDFLQILSKETGLSKAKLFKFVEQKDFSVIALDNLLSLLDSFDSTILIVPK